jgi:hypothetical protein
MPLVYGKAHVHLNTLCLFWIRKKCTDALKSFYKNAQRNEFGDSDIKDDGQVQSALVLPAPDVFAS